KPRKKDVQEKPPEEVAEVTTTKCSISPEWDHFQADSPKAVRETGKELRTLGEALARSRLEQLQLELECLRHHINSVKRGGDYFHILHQESLERKKAAQKTRGMRWTTEFQPSKNSSDEESEEEINNCSLAQGSHLKKKKKMNLRSFAPVYTSVLILNPAGAKSEHLFQQLCAIHWLLEALTLDSIGSMRSILTCWNPADPGGCKKTAKEIEEEKLATYMWEFFTTNKKKGTWRAQYSLLSRKISKTSTPGISQLSRQSSSCGQTPHGSETSTALCSVDSVKINVASSDVRSESVQAKEQQCLFPSLQKVIQIMREEVSKDTHKQKDLVKKIGMQRLLPVAQNHKANMPLIKDQESVTPSKQQPRSFLCCFYCSCHSKFNLCADMRQKFTEIRKEAARSLHDALVSLERSQEKRCRQKYQALKQLKTFRRDMERIRHLDMKADREDDEDGLKWFPVLLARLPESVKSDHYVQKILKKLEKYGKTPDLKIQPDTFLKVLEDLQVWELCSPEIAAAVEFVRESIVQMPEEDFSEWLQTKVASLSAESSTI
ncbi:PREDICTED: coiled-coil domain-containing protein 60, partial [Apaloderma vittatum]|uniref:coiled-coil domain-containing protein 60 n=1 Tax=Apaloderma vittatum TaxID=57397 RepID=UPI00052159BD